MQLTINSCSSLNGLCMFMLELETDLADQMKPKLVLPLCLVL